MGNKGNDLSFPDGKFKAWIIAMTLLFGAMFMGVLFVWGKDGNSIHEKMADYVMYLIAGTIGGYVFGLNRFFKK